MGITVHYGKTARLTAIKKKTVAIIGYGSQRPCPRTKPA